MQVYAICQCGGQLPLGCPGFVLDRSDWVWSVFAGARLATSQLAKLNLSQLTLDHMSTEVSIEEMVAEFANVFDPELGLYMACQ